jgi:hypothetical protein
MRYPKLALILGIVVILLLVDSVYSQPYCLLRTPQYSNDPCPCYAFYLAATNAQAPRATIVGGTCQVTAIGAREGYVPDTTFPLPFQTFGQGDAAMGRVSPYYDDLYGCQECRSGAKPKQQPSSASGSSLLETVYVPADQQNPVYTSMILEQGKSYIIEASGVYSCWSDHPEGGVDAYYCFAEWRCGKNGEAWNQLLLDDKPMAEIARGNGDSDSYNPGHIYRTTIVGNGAPLILQISDAKNSWSDNLYGLSVNIYG